MRIFADRIQVEKGEAWTYDVLFQNRDGSPFIISSGIDNPHIVVTVASSRYDQQNRYIANFWCDVKEQYPTFYCTQPILIDGTTIPTPANALTMAALADMKEHNCTYANYCIYARENSGTLYYYQWVPTGDTDDGINGSYETYSFPFKQVFPSTVTKQWIEHNYVFAIKLVGGTLNDSYDDSDITSRPLVSDESVFVIVPPTQLVVVNSITGSII